MDKEKLPEETQLEEGAPEGSTDAEQVRSAFEIIKTALISPYVLGITIPIIITFYLLFHWDECSAGTLFSALCYVSLASTVSVVWGLYFLTALMFFIVDLFFDKKKVYKSEMFVKFMVLVVCALLVYGTASILSLWIFFTKELQDKI